MRANNSTFDRLQAAQNASFSNSGMAFFNASKEEWATMIEKMKSAGGACSAARKEAADLLKEANKMVNETDKEEDDWDREAAIQAMGDLAESAANGDFQAVEAVKARKAEEGKS